MSHPAAASDDTLPDRLAADIALRGPITVGEYMLRAHFDPRGGAYATRDPIGAGGDFVTAPEISPMFGELLGLWAVQTWLELGRPAQVDLVELGPGRGVMAADMLRAAQSLQNTAEGRGFLIAARLRLVEPSPALQAVQAQALARAPIAVEWVTLAEALGGDRPRIVIANEVLDCLPVRQAVRHSGAWRERRVGLAPDAAKPQAGRPRFAFVLDPAPLPAADLALLPAGLVDDPPEGALVEFRPGVADLADGIGRALRAAPGRALFLDYGPAVSEYGDTLQALRRHEKVSPLGAPGTADLTARVDFAAARADFIAGLVAAGLRADAAAAAVAGPVEQGVFLRALGLEVRAAALARANPERRGNLAAQVFRLTDPAQMGALFKALCVSSPGLPPPAGF